jgi:hypothetical protein
MKVTRFEDKTEWEQFRLGKITGSRLKDLIVKRGTEMKKGYYDLIAERLTTTHESDEVPAMQRGNILEPQAVTLFMEEMLYTNGTPLEEWEAGLVIWQREDNPNIALSPDCYHIDLEKAVEVKCLNSGEHIKSYLTKEIPDVYEEQVIQYFIVNEKLETLYFAMFDPRFILDKHKFFYLTLNRKDLETKITDYYTQQVNMLDRVEAIVIRETDGLF